MNNGPGAWKGTFLQGSHAWEPRLDDTKRSWSVCPHLSRPDELCDYYLDRSAIMILMGKVLCYECYEIITARNDLSEYINVSTHMTDQRFQNDFIHPLIEANQELLFGKGHTRDEWSWVCCSHVAQKGRLKALYSGCHPMFVLQGNVTCKDCVETIPSTSDFIRAVLDCEAMTDSRLQEKVIAPLYLINREVLDAIGYLST